MTKYKYSGKELVKRYKDQYFIPDEIEITEEMVIKHWELEKGLTHKLINSTPENRWETFDYCYSTLFKELDWANKHIEIKDQAPIEVKYEIYINFIGKEPKVIYEIGSGKGELISYLASLGHTCRATEISKERGEKHVPKELNITWANSDGINLEKFEKENTYDYVISNAVIEHMHPDDIKKHFEGVKKILKPGGKFIFFTIHKFYGPIDISKVFGMEKPMGMHLKEYMIHELIAELRKAGLNKISFPYRMFTKKFYKYTPFAKNEIGWITFLEKCLNLLPYKLRKKMLAFEKNIFPIVYFYIVAEKSSDQN